MKPARPRLADLCCGGGGASKGLDRAGFDVVGFDIEPQPRYPFEFHQQDVMDVDLSGFQAVWASPPCKIFSNANQSKAASSSGDLITPVRQKIKDAGHPYIIENVPGAPLENHITLCGQSFNLQLLRHRWFESNCLLWGPQCPGHYDVRTGLGPRFRGWSSFARGANVITVVGNHYNFKDGKIAMGIDWMGKKELTQAVPPAYSEHLGRQLLEFC